jgi:hypothetical protein
MRKKSVLLALVILTLGLVGTGLSALYQQNEQIDRTLLGFTHKVSYGFPLAWHGYSFTIGAVHFPEIYWFSLGSLLLDAVFWVAISFFVCTATMKSVSILQKTRASRNLSVINI